RSFDLQRLVQQLGKLIENGIAASHDGRPGGGRRSLQFLVLQIGESDNGNVFGFRVSFQLADGGANVSTARSQVGNDHQRFFLQRQQDQRLDITDRLYPIAQVLQPVDQLAAGQQGLIECEGQRCRHGSKLKYVVASCKIFCKRLSRTLPHSWFLFQ